MLSNLGKFKEYFSFFFQFINLLKELIKTVEEEGPEEGGGEEKKQTVLDMVSLAYDFFNELLDDLPIKKEKFMSIADEAIEVIVRFYNIINIFK